MKIFSDVVEEVKELCKYVKPPNELSYYLKVANTAFDFAYNFPDHK